MKLERLGLAERTAPGCWELAPGLEPALRDLGLRGDIIKTMHRAMTASGGEADPGRFAMHTEPPTDPVIGKLVERGLHAELPGPRAEQPRVGKGGVSQCRGRWGPEN